MDSPRLFLPLLSCQNRVPSATILQGACDPDTRSREGRALNELLRRASVAIILLVLSGGAAGTVGAQSAAPSGTATVISPDGLNLRAGPSITAAIVQVLPFDATLTLTGASTADGWYPATAATLSGWVDGAYIAAGALDPAAARSAAPLVGAPTVLAAAGPTPAAHSTSASAPPAITAGALSPTAGTLKPGQTETMAASYYGVDDTTVPGTMTACGVPFDPFNIHDASTNDFSCGTKLLVSAPGGKQIEVVVTDHGSYVPHWVDLTYAAFDLIADHRQGVVQVTVQVEP